MNTDTLPNNVADNDAEALFQSGMRYLKKEEREHETFKSYAARKSELPDEREYAEGMALLERAAKQGLLKAQSTLGDFYTLGVSVKGVTDGARICKRDEGKGVYWYAEAAKQGDKEAARMLGHIYELKVVNSNEEPDSNDVDKSAYWFVHAGAYSNAAYILDKTGQPDNYDRALKYYETAVSSDKMDIIEYLDCTNKITTYAHNRELDFYESGMKEARGEALRHYKSALLRHELAVKLIKEKIHQLEKHETEHGGNDKNDLYIYSFSPYFFTPKKQ